jgi:hypothetical protein
VGVLKMTSLTRLFSHKLACETQIDVGKINLKPTTTARSIVQFRAKQCRPLNMHPEQMVRLMSNSGHDVLRPEMVINGALMIT